jgi:hypothetical protein
MQCAPADGNVVIISTLKLKVNMRNESDLKGRKLKSQRSFYLLCPYLKGLDYKDPHGGTPDFGVFTCYDGKYIATWGLSLFEDELMTGEDYVWDYIYPAGRGKVKTFERIISKVS